MALRVITFTNISAPDLASEIRGNIVQRLERGGYTVTADESDTVCRRQAVLRLP